MLKHVVWMGLLAAGALTASPAQATLIFAEGFETPVAPPGGFTNVSSPGMVGGFAVTSGNVDTVNTGFFNSFAGSQSLDLNGSSSGTISRMFNVVAGMTYQLMFAYANNPDNGASANVSVSNSTFGTSLITHVGSTKTNMNYTMFSQMFTAAAGGTSTLTFASANSGSAGIVLDAVQVNSIDAPGPPVVSAVPEPTTLALGGIGGLALLGRSLSSPSDGSRPESWPRKPGAAVPERGSGKTDACWEASVPEPTTKRPPGLDPRRASSFPAPLRPKAGEHGVAVGFVGDCTPLGAEAPRDGMAPVFPRPDSRVACSHDAEASGEPADAGRRGRAVGDARPSVRTSPPRLDAHPPRTHGVRAWQPPCQGSRIDASLVSRRGCGGGFRCRDAGVRQRGRRRRRSTRASRTGAEARGGRGLRAGSRSSPRRSPARSRFRS